MKKLFVGSAVLAVAAVGLLAGSALSSSLPSEWGVVNPDPLTAPQGFMASYTGQEAGYYIWTDDEARTSWHIHWTDGGSNDWVGFNGSIVLENNTGEFTEYKFEINDPNDPNDDDFTRINSSDTALYFGSFVWNGVDGIDFTITQTASPSYVGFSLYQDMDPMDPSKIYLGENMITVLDLDPLQDHDFSIAAPVPEPATMLLFGTGLAGLAGLGRRKKKE